MNSMNIKEIVASKPYLKDIFRLYENVEEFSEIVLKSINGHMNDKAACYPPDLIDQVFRKFSSIFEIPVENLAPLNEAMSLGQIDFTRLPLNEVPAFSLPYHEDELSMLLFIIGKPYFLALGKKQDEHRRAWEAGRCPVCNALPVLSSIDWEGRRHLYCSFCGTKGQFKRISCPVCKSTENEQLNIITAEEEEGFRIDTCDACKSYIKTVQADRMENLAPDYVDLLSLPLDIIAQNKGYKRNTPNPIGMLRIP